jgi:hypothetical protein
MSTSTITESAPSKALSNFLLSMIKQQTSALRPQNFSVSFESSVGISNKNAARFFDRQFDVSAA